MLLWFTVKAQILMLDKTILLSGIQIASWVLVFKFNVAVALLLQAVVHTKVLLVGRTEAVHLNLQILVILILVYFWRGSILLITLFTRA